MSSKQEMVFSYQVLWSSLLKIVELTVDFSQPLVDFIQLGLQTLVLLVISVKLSLVILPFLIISNRRELTVGKKKKEIQC